jgi:hypothetical protein
MAQQKGTVQIQGTIGNLTFFKSVDGYMVKAKSAIAKDRILSDPKFLRTRENMSEFGNAGQAGKKLRTPFTGLLKMSSDLRMVSRLTALCTRVLKTDVAGKRGKRTVANGDMSLFNDFEFNNKGILSTTLLAPYTIAFTRTTGNVQFDLPSFSPQLGIAAPQGATHYRLQLAAAAVNFNAKKNIAVQTGSDVLAWDNNPATALSLTLSLPANATYPVFVLLQIQFLEQLNTDYYPLQNGAYNACAIIDVDIPTP